MKIGIICKDLNINIPLKDALEKESSFSIKNLLSSCEIDSSIDEIVVFGGDGTMLDASIKASEFNIPILGINLGNIGFLTELESTSNINDLIKALNEKDTFTRNILDLYVNGEKVGAALNEIVIKTESSRPIRISLYINGDYVDNYQSDGIICSTATGSTAYSLSAGGPILAPDVKALIINPICPHTLHSRPIVINYNSRVSFNLQYSEKACLSADGNKLLCDLNNCEIEIKKSDKVATFIKASNINFYEKLLKKMNRWGITQ